MLVKELIVLLSQHNPDDDVYINFEDEEGDEIISEIECVELDVMPGALKTSVCILAV